MILVTFLLPRFGLRRSRWSLLGEFHFEPLFFTNKIEYLGLYSKRATINYYKVALKKNVVQQNIENTHFKLKKTHLRQGEHVIEVYL